MLPKSLPRRSSRQKAVFCSAIAFVLVSCTLAFAQSLKAQQNSKATSGGAVARGKYIVENVAICAQCHTPRDYDGNPDRSHWLQGSSVPFNPVKADPNWPLSAPRIGGTPLPASDGDMVKLLTTGIWTNGEHLRPPMPQFRLTQDDAEAVVAYLKSLNAQQ